MTRKQEMTSGFMSSTQVLLSVLGTYVYDHFYSLMQPDILEQNNPGDNRKELITPDTSLFIQTKKSKDAGQNADEDDDPPVPADGNPGSHVGSIQSPPLVEQSNHFPLGYHGSHQSRREKYGIAKKATIIPVKIFADEEDMIEGFARIYDHIVANNRASKSVIVCSLGTAGTKSRQDVINDPDLGAMLIWFNAIMDLGTPIVLAAGNARDGSERAEIDTFPQVLEAADTPIINVGAAGRDGGLAEFSQGGPQLTVHAPGVKVFALKKDSTSDLYDGTSVGRFSLLYYTHYTWQNTDTAHSCPCCSGSYRNLHRSRWRALGQRDR